MILKLISPKSALARILKISIQAISDRLARILIGQFGFKDNIRILGSGAVRWRPHITFQILTHTPGLQRTTYILSLFTLIRRQFICIGILGPLDHVYYEVFFQEDSDIIVQDFL
jgi:hypothetical protein